MAGAQLMVDIWFIISCLLSVKDLLNLQLTCKCLRDIMAEHYVWYRALKDILTIVFIPDLSRINLALFSAEELKRRAVLAARVDYVWRQPKVTPKVRIVDIPCNLRRIIKAKLIPGGEWLVNLLSDGTLCLQAVTSNMPCIIDSSFSLKTENPDLRISLSLSPTNETLVLLRTWSWDASAASPSITIALYRVDTVTPRFHLLMRTTRLHDRPYENALAAEGNLWAFSWCQNSRQLLLVRNITMTEGETEKEVVLDIGEPIHATLSILSEQYILATSCTKVSLYNIPELQPVDANVNSPIIAVTSVWTRDYEDTYNYPAVGPIYWRPSGSHEGSLALYTGHYLRFFRQFDGDQHCTLTSYRLRSYPNKPTLSDRRVIWAERGLWNAKSTLKVCVFPLSYGGKHDAGLIRFGHTGSEKSETLQAVPFPLRHADAAGEIGDLSWDETSGRMCVLFTPPPYPGQKKWLDARILLIDSV